MNRNHNPTLTLKLMLRKLDYYQNLMVFSIADAEFTCIDFV